MDSETCVLLHMGVYLEEYLRLHPTAKYLFTSDSDPKAPARLKSNHRNNLDRHVLHVEDFQELCDEEEELGLGTHSWRKGAADEARKQGALADEIEIRGRWKPQGRRVVFRYIDVKQLHIDAKVAGVLCKGGPIKYKLKVGLENRITDDWLFTYCVPHIRQRFANDRRLCKIFGLTALYAYCDPTLRGYLTEFQVTRISAGLNGLGVECTDNCVERVPLHIYSVNGNLCIDEVNTAGTFLNAGGVAATATGTAPGANTAVLQSILLQQQRTAQSVSALHMHVDSQFQVMKVWQQQRFATMCDNIRRFGGTIQGGFARQDPVQAGNRRRAVAQNRNAPNRPDDGNAELCPNLHTLQDLWDEYKFGIGGRKPASQFTSQERGGYGVNKKKQRYSRRKRIWDIMERLIREGDTVDRAIIKIKRAYGERSSPSKIMEAIGGYGVHPTLLGANAPANAFFAPRQSVVRAVRGGRINAGVPRGGPRTANVPRLPDTQVGLQAELNQQLMGDGPGGPDHVMFQNPTLRVEI